mmetsp:Transcript_31746/g.91975  ORF Transcript_31746/g.91975 Transcript_31746/m.91975 type:complete len:132 (-) Transcript_31746:7-402(-)
MQPSDSDHAPGPASAAASAAKKSSGRKATDEKDKPLPLWQKAFLRDAEFDKNEVADVLHWTRQFAALVLGIAFGLMPVKGIVGVAGGPLLIVITGLSWSRYVDVGEDVMEPKHILMEGTLPAIGTFLVHIT